LNWGGQDLAKRLDPDPKVTGGRNPDFRAVPIAVFLFVWPLKAATASGKGRKMEIGKEVNSKGRETSIKKRHGTQKTECRCRARPLVRLSSRRLPTRGPGPWAFPQQGYPLWNPSDDLVFGCGGYRFLFGAPMAGNLQGKRRAAGANKWARDHGLPLAKTKWGKPPHSRRLTTDASQFIGAGSVGRHRPTMALRLYVVPATKPIRFG